jgi:hypothetical protein
MKLGQIQIEQLNRSQGHFALQGAQVGEHGIQGSAEAIVVEFLWRNPQHQVGTPIFSPLFDPIEGHRAGETVTDQRFGHLAMAQVALLGHGTAFINDLGESQPI